MSDNDSYSSPDIAVVGMAGRFPGADDLDQLWRNLREGVESITFFSDEELLAAGVSADLLRSESYVKASPVLNGIDLFDASFFGYSPREAELMDPQHRLFLECAWEALESAGCDAETHGGRIGVFASTGMPYYVLANLGVLSTLQALFGNEKDYLATKVAYKLNLTGPAVGIQTACSSALVAVCFACQSLLDYQSDVALAGGVNIRLPHRTGYLYQEEGIYSPDGHCRSFDARGKGTIFGSGLGIVALMRLEDALAKGFPVRAVIKGSAVNNDGSGRAGYTAPSQSGQAQVVAMAQASAGVEPETITCIEAHGTGTPLGDPIEVAALEEVFRASTRRQGFCALGSVKTNLGHLDAASGIAGLIKMVLALEHGEIPASLGFERPNPRIDFASSPFYVNTKLTPWKAEGAPRRGGVSSFGIGGTNAHVVLEEAPAVPAASPAPRPWHLLPLSAKGGGRLEVAARRLSAHLRERPDLPLADVGYTLQVGRRALSHRGFALCRDLAEAESELEKLAVVAAGSRQATDRRAIFMFPGGGAQHPGMGLEIYRHEPVFRTEVDRCLAISNGLLGLDLRALLYPEAGQEAAAARQLRRTSIALPALFSCEYALAKLWMHWGVRPQAMIGHSLGEYVAACLSEVLSLEDALSLVALRGQLFEKLPPGAMLSVPLPEEAVKPLLDSGLSIAAINAPSFCVVSGGGEALDRLAESLGQRGVESRRIHIEVAAHSVMVEPILDEFTSFVRHLRLLPPRIPYISNISGTWITPAEATDPTYWRLHLRRTVRFADGVGELLREPSGMLLEVGPGRTLTTLARMHPQAASGPTVLASLPHPEDRQPDLGFLLTTLGRLWQEGVRIDWQAFHRGEKRRRVALPTYPFERRQFWIEPPRQEPHKEPKARIRTGPNELPDWFYLPCWKPALPLVSGAAAVASGWLVLADSCGLSDRIVERLGRRGDRVVRVVPGDRFARLGDLSYAIRPGEPEDYDALLAALGGELPQVIAHFWSVTADAPERPAHERLQSCQESGFYSLLALGQALARHPARPAVRIGVVSNHLQSVGGERSLQPAKASVLGPVKVLPREIPSLVCRSIDVVLSDFSGTAGERRIERLLAELESGSGDPVVAHRAGQRWLQDFEPIRLEEAVGDRGALRERGVYLITGGLGGMALVLAEWLARRAAARLILVGRSGLPPRDEWGSWLATHGGRHEVSRRILAVQALEELGAEVAIEVADVTDPVRMRAVIASGRERFGGIHGVIHTAGLISGGMAQLKERAAAARIMAPKVEGVFVLEEALAGEPLDFFVLCSSLVGIAGDFGQVDYSAANAVLDAFAHNHWQRTGIHTVAIDWPLWRDTGMVVRAAAAYERAVRSSLAGESVGHPLLHSRTVAKDGAEVIFHTAFDPQRQWVLAEHRILGNPVVPGTAYLEMARAAFQAGEPPGGVVIEDLAFLQPLIVREDEIREAQTFLQRNGEATRFVVRSRGAEGEPWLEHATGTIRSLPLRSRGQRPVEELAAGLAEAREVDGRTGQGGPIYWGPRWQSLRRLRLGMGEAYAWVELPPEFVSDLEGFALHPALLDVATACGLGLVETSGYLPLAYKRVAVRAVLPGRFYVHTRARQGAGEGRAVISFDLEVFDESGAECLAIEEFSLRRIDDAAAAARSVQKAASAATAAGEEGSLRSGISSGEGARVFELILGRGVAPQVIVSPEDLHALLAAARETVAEESLAAEVEEGRAGSAARHLRPDLRTPYVAPRDSREEKVAALWQDLLGLDRVGVDDSFFELGGHSLLGIQLVSKVRQTFGFELSLGSLFESPTVAEIAALLKAEPGPRSTPAPPPLERVSREQELPLSFAQQRLWFLAQLEPESPAYNVPSVLRLEGGLDLAALEESLHEILSRHEVLRTTFSWSGTGPVQVIAPPAPYRLPQIDLTALPAAARRPESMRLADEEAHRPFDLERGPLLRSFLLRLAAEEHVILLTMHHILSDVWSLGVLIREVTALYAAFSAGLPSPLPALAVQYADYAHWQRSWMQGEVLAAELAYWRKRLAPPLPVLELPTDHPRSARTSARGARHGFLIPRDGSAAIAELGRSEGATVFMVLLAAFNCFLYRLTGQTDLIVGTDVANRNRTETEAMIGFFVNMLALRTDLSGVPTFRELLRRVREVTLEAYLHQDLPLDKLVEELRPDRDLSHSPLFRVLFVLQNIPPQGMTSPGLKMSLIESETETSKFDLSLFMDETAQGLAGKWVFKTDLFDPATVARFARRFEVLLASIANHPDARLDDLEILTADEQRGQSMERARHEQKSFQKFKAVKPKSVARGGDLVREGSLDPARPFPVVIEPVVGDLDPEDWVGGNRELLLERLAKHGAILLRGFGVRSEPEFEKVASAFCPDLFGEYGDLPQADKSAKVYASTPYPADKTILFHNESSHMHRWPLKQLFFCVTPAREGGETPIVDCREIYRSLRPELLAPFRDKGLLYVRNFVEGLDVSWQEFFRTDQREAVEEHCRSAGLDFEWTPEGGLRTLQTAPAVAKHPLTGEMVFFNQVQLHHPVCLDAEVRKSLSSLFGPQALPRNVLFGDRSPIPDEVMLEILQVYWDHAVSFPWQAGDVLMLDNMMVAHARNPFEGPRKIAVAMGEMFDKSRL
jgi:phthiocerol/phenolphthiocerol synthesis type-I polyketide synthase E